jgi:hypothetical protein
VLRNIARWAGVHIYSDAGDVLYANKCLLGVHTVAGGERVFRLPRRAEAIYDLFEQKIIAQNVSEFRATLAPLSTAGFRFGPG